LDLLRFYRECQRQEAHCPQKFRFPVHLMIRSGGRVSLARA
jgi:hypothetical protein